MPFGKSSKDFFFLNLFLAIYTMNCIRVRDFFWKFFETSFIDHFRISGEIFIIESFRNLLKNSHRKLPWVCLKNMHRLFHMNLYENSFKKSKDFFRKASTDTVRNSYKKCFGNSFRNFPRDTFKNKIVQDLKSAKASYRNCTVVFLVEILPGSLETLHIFLHKFLQELSQNYFYGFLPIYGTIHSLFAALISL